MNIQTAITHDDKYNTTIEITVGKTVAEIVFDKADGHLNVLCCNASNAASSMRGLGRFFATWEDELAGYKSTAMKAAISTAKEWVDEVNSADTVITTTTTRAAARNMTTDALAAAIHAGIENPNVENELALRFLPSDKYATAPSAVVNFEEVRPVACELCDGEGEIWTEYTSTGDIKTTPCLCQS